MQYPEKNAPEQNENLWLLASKQIKSNNINKRRLNSYKAMKVSILFPYWEDVHDRVIETLEWLTEPVWSYKPSAPDARSIKQIVLHMIERERYWIVQIAQKGPREAPSSREFRTKELLIEGFESARNQTIHYIESLDEASLKAVRTLPADSQSGTVETNRQISWILWETMHHEIYHWGQIEQRRNDSTQ